MATKIEIETYLKYAELANAAYAFDGSKYTLEDYLVNTRSFSRTQANQFVKQYWSDKNFKIQAQTSYEYFNGSPSGFKAALLKSDSGEYILTIAGTDPDLGDISADLNLVGGKLGEQFKHLVEYVNYLKDKVLPDGAKMTVTGHSLGGALTQMTAATFPDLVSQAYTFNSPGAESLSIPEIILVDGKIYEVVSTDPLVKQEISQDLYDAYNNYKKSHLQTPKKQLTFKD